MSEEKPSSARSESPEGTPGSVGLRELLLVLLGGVLLTVCATWPLATEIDSDQRVADRTLDDLILYWNCWWTHEAVVEEQRLPWDCDRIFHPEGANIVVSPFILPMTLFSLPLQAQFGTLTGAMMATKLVALLSFVVAVLGMHLFLRGWGLGAAASFLGGAFFAFVPFRLVHMTRVHYLAGALAPLFLFFFLQAMRTGRWRWEIAAALSYALLGAMDAASLTELAFTGVVVWLFLPRPRPALLLRLGRAAQVVGMGLLLLSPILVPFLQEMNRNPGADITERLEFHYRPLPSDLFNSPDLNHLCLYLSPSLHERLPEDSVWSSESEGTRSVLHSFRPPGPLPELESLAAGLCLLFVLAAVAGGLWQLRASWVFALLAALGFLLAMGPYRVWDDEVVRMPYYWLSRVLPGMSAARYTAFFLRLFYFGLVTVAALGLQRASGSLRGAGFGVLILVAAAWLSRPFQLETIAVEDCHQQIAADPEPGVVLELPHLPEPARKKMAFGQITHERPTSNGPLSRSSDEIWKHHDRLPLVAWLEHPGAPFGPEEIEQNRRVLHELGVRYLVVRRVMWARAGARWREERALRERYLDAHRLPWSLTAEGHLLVRVD